MKYFEPMSPEERTAHEKVREARKNAPMSRGDLIQLAVVFAGLGLLAYAANAGWLA